jgi:hypothetical protein
MLLITTFVEFRVEEDEGGQVAHMPSPDDRC